MLLAETASTRKRKAFCAMSHALPITTWDAASSSGGFTFCEAAAGGVQPFAQ